MSLPHDSAHLHVSGRSEFIDDRPVRAGELFVEVVTSPHARAEILSIDFKKAMALPGVRGVFLAKDIAHNVWGTIFKDQPLLADQEVHFVGESVALVAAVDRETAARARELVVVKYKTLPAILTISDARQARSFIGPERTIQRGDVEAALKTAPQRLEGKIVLRGAEHFYLENQAAIAYPLEDGQIEVHSSSQHPTEVQHVVAHALGIPDKDVICIVKRMGGAFGGKESQGAPYAAYAALVSQKLGVPARVVLNKDDDMISTGKRNPFENEYRVGFDDDGRILALDVKLFSDGGAYADLSTSIMERAMLHCDNAYFIPAFRATGQVCRTHIHPHTAFRGFGGPKGVATIEKIIEQIAHEVGKDSLEIRKLNCYTAEGGRDIAPYGQKIENNQLPALFEQIERDAEYRVRRQAIVKSNREAVGNPLLPFRGLSVTAVKFGISFTTRFLNQANALVLIHRDGTLQVSTGATEMGQGVNARIAELVAQELGLKRESVRMMPTATDKNANTSPTAASSGTDLNGAAALLATRRLKARLSALASKLSTIHRNRWPHLTAGPGSELELKVDETLPEFDSAHWPIEPQSYHNVTFEGGRVRTGAWSCTFEELIHEAYFSRVSLSEYAHYRFPGLSFNKETGQGQAFLYYTQGVAASEVEVDQFTGEVKVRRVDILMDLGRPVNRDLDLGQVTGGFVQGQGWMTTEKLHYNDQGALLSHAPSTYKIPSIHDTPRDFRVHLVNNDGNLPNVARTKAVGEPPLLLAISVWTAIHDALKGLKAGFPDLEVPATQEEVLRALDPEAFREWEGR